MSSNDNKLVVILIGPPGVGKGSQASKLCHHFGLAHISTGDILRANIKNQTELGTLAKDIIEKGELVSDDLINAMLSERINEPDCSNGYLLDGFPRTLAQAEEFDIKTNGSIRLKVINLVASDDIVVERISGRLCCRGCSATYHKTFKPPKQEGICDICGSELYQRNDDNASVVLDRLKVYKKQTEPLVNYYKEKHSLYTLSCEKSIDEIFQEAIQIISEKKS